jgi:hypothetical protein
MRKGRKEEKHRERGFIESVRYLRVWKKIRYN